MYKHNLFSNYDREQIKKIFLNHILDLTTIHESDKLVISLFTANTNLSSKTILDEATAEFIGLLFKLNVYNYNIDSLDDKSKVELTDIANGCCVTLDYLVSLSKDYFERGILESKLSDILVNSVMTLYSNVFSKRKYLGLKLPQGNAVDYLKEGLDSFTIKVRGLSDGNIRYKITGIFKYGSFTFNGDLYSLSLELSPNDSNVSTAFPNIPETYLKSLRTAISYFHLIISKSLSMDSDGVILTYDKDKPTSLRIIFPNS